MKTYYVKHKVTGLKNIIVVEDEIPDFILDEYDVFEEDPDIPVPQEIVPETLEQAKQRKKYEIFEAFKNQFAQGMYSHTLGTSVDCRKLPFQQQEDLANIRVLLEYMRKNNIEKTYYRDFFNNNIPNVTQVMLEGVIAEMEAYGIAQYMKKHQMDDAISAAQTIEEVNTIMW